MSDTIEMLRPAEVFRRAGMKKEGYYKQVREGLQLPFVPIGSRAVALPAHEQQSILRARIRGADNDAIRSLVSSLLEARKQQCSD